MTHALVAAENKNFTQATRSLERLVTLNRETSFAHYNLGLIAQEQEDSDRALTH